MIKVSPGDFKSFGAYENGNTISFTIASESAYKMTLHLFKKGEEAPFESIVFPEECVLGDVYSMVLEGDFPKETEYAYSVNDSKEFLLDPYAKAITDYTVWGKKQSFKGLIVPEKVLKRHVFPLKEKPSKDQIMIYELHVKGFTADESSGVENPGSFKGLKEKISYIKDLGMNTVELLPVFSFDKTERSREYEGERLYNYWGYNTVGYFAPHNEYASDKNALTAIDELKDLVESFHKNGITVVLDVVFNHTAESDKEGPVISFKGLDDNVYYMKDVNGDYANLAGCGNTLNCNNEVVSSYILSVLEYWVLNYGIDGFRFDLASVFNRNEDGSVTQSSNIIRKIEHSPVLKDTLLFAEAWDAAGLYQVGCFSSNDRWMEWNGIYRDDLRQYLRGNENSAFNAVMRITGSTDIYDPYFRGETASLNFITCHDGFTLYDLYSYNEKHNIKNGWNNNDGDNYGFSWNCGAEGETEDESINALRARMVKNAFAALFLSRGALMFPAGDEFLKTRGGNNNPYCQDNETEYIDWKNESQNREIHKFTHFLTNFRNKHEILRHRLEGESDSGFPDISFHHGVPFNSECNRDARLIGMVLAGKNKEGEEDTVYIAMNMYWEDLTVTLPAPAEGFCWRKEIDTSKSSALRPRKITKPQIVIEKRSIVVLVLAVC